MADQGTMQRAAVKGDLVRFYSFGDAILGVVENIETSEDTAPVADVRVIEGAPNNARPGELVTADLDRLTVVEMPAPEPPADLDWRAIAEWALSGDTGTSSQTIVRRIAGLAPQGWSRSGHPHDLDDFGRCYRLLERIPSLRPYLPTLRAEGPVWSALVDAWDAISAAYAAHLAAAQEASQSLPLARWYFGQPVYNPATLATARAADRLLVAALHNGDPRLRSVEQVEAAWAAYDEAEARKARGEPDPDDDPDDDFDDDDEWDDDDDPDDED